MSNGAFAEHVKWWATERKLEEIVSTEELLPAFHDVAIACATRIMRRLEDPKTPDAVKDKIALTFAPRLTTEFKGKLGKGGAGKASKVDEVLGAYRLGNG